MDPEAVETIAICETHHGRLRIGEVDMLRGSATMADGLSANLPVAQGGGCLECRIAGSGCRFCLLCCSL